jgi:hypothetical protein
MRRAAGWFDSALTIRTVPARLVKRGDIVRPVIEGRQALPRE